MDPKLQLMDTFLCDAGSCKFIAAIADKSMVMEQIMPHLGQFHPEYIHVGSAVEETLASPKKAVDPKGGVPPCPQPHVLVSCAGRKNNRPRVLDPKMVTREQSLVSADPAQRCSYQRISNDVIIDSDDLETFYVATCGLTRVNGTVYCEKHSFLVKRGPVSSKR